MYEKYYADTIFIIWVDKVTKLYIWATKVKNDD